MDAGRYCRDPDEEFENYFDLPEEGEQMIFDEQVKDSESVIHPGKSGLCRVIGHIDMDCFYVQAERSINPSLKGKPVAVVQYNPFGDLRTLTALDNRILTSSYNGSLIAVSYEARARGVKRIMRGAEAKAVCPELVMVQVPMSYQKADLTLYRDVSDKIISIFKGFGCCVEKASIDEVFIDLTDLVQSELLGLAADASAYCSNMEAIEHLSRVCKIAGEDRTELSMSRKALSRGHEGGSGASAAGGWADVFGDKLTFATLTVNDKCLLLGALIIESMRRKVFDTLEFTCSGGVAHNKMLSKIASGMHKPNQLTVVPNSIVENLMLSMPISRVPGFGGKLGRQLSSLSDSISVFGDIRPLDMQSKVRAHFGNAIGQKIINISFGLDDDQVRDRYLVKTIGCSKNFHSPSQWLNCSCFEDGTLECRLTALAAELFDRVQVDSRLHKRKPKTLVVGAAVRNIDQKKDCDTDKNGTQNPESLTNEKVTFGWDTSTKEHLSRVGPMKHSVQAITEAAISSLRRAIAENDRIVAPWKIYSLSLSATQFDHVSNSIDKFLVSKEANNFEKGHSNELLKSMDIIATCCGGSQQDGCFMHALDPPPISCQLGTGSCLNSANTTATTIVTTNTVKQTSNSIVEVLSKSSIGSEPSSSKEKGMERLDGPIDMEVFKCLPPHLQTEIRFSLRGSKQLELLGQSNDKNKKPEQKKKKSKASQSSLSSGPMSKYCKRG